MRDHRVAFDDCDRHSGYAYGLARTLHALRETLRRRAECRACGDREDGGWRYTLIRNAFPYNPGPPRRRW